MGKGKFSIAFRKPNQKRFTVGTRTFRTKATAEKRLRFARRQTKEAERENNKELIFRFKIVKTKK